MAAKSVTIIGGADGPTSVFLAGKIGSGFWIGIIVSAIAILLVTVLLAGLFRPAPIGKADTLDKLFEILDAVSSVQRH